MMIFFIVKAKVKNVSPVGPVLGLPMPTIDALVQVRLLQVVMRLQMPVVIMPILALMTNAVESQRNVVRRNSKDFIWVVYSRNSCNMLMTKTMTKNQMLTQNLLMMSVIYSQTLRHLWNPCA